MAGTIRWPAVSEVIVQPGAITHRWAYRPWLLAAAVVGAVIWCCVAVELFPWAGSYSAGDLALYVESARRLLSGAVPYRDFAFEYPPLALLPIALPGALLGSGLPTGPHYNMALLVCNAICAVGLGACVVRLARHVAPDRPLHTIVAGYATLVLIGVPLFPWRFDLFVTLLSAAGILLALERKPAWAGAALGAAIATKLYPVVLVPVIAAWYLATGDRRSAARCVIATAVTTLLATVPFYVAAPQDFFSFVSYHSRRGFQVESLVAGVVLLRHAIHGTAVEMVEKFGAVHLAAPMPRGVELALVAAVFATTTGVAWLAFARFRAEHGREGTARPATLLTAAFAAVMLVLVLNKVLSPQYLAWLLPFAPLAPRRAFSLTAAATGLTIIVFPCLYVGLVHVEPLPVLFLNARNLTLAVLTAYLVWSLRPMPTGTPALTRRQP